MSQQQQHLIMLEQWKSMTALTQLATEITKFHTVQAELALFQQRASQPTEKVTAPTSNPPTTTNDTKPPVLPPYKEWGHTEEPVKVLSRYMVTWASKHTGPTGSQSLPRICSGIVFDHGHDDRPSMWRFVDKWLEHMVALGNIDVVYYGDLGKCYYWAASLNALYVDEGLQTAKMAWEF